MKKLIFCIMIAGALAACGVKPSNVKPPEGATEIYPDTYPHAPDEELEAARRAAEAPARARRAQMDATE